MIKFSKREDYAFVLLNYLARNKKIVSLSDVSKKYNISSSFLRNIALQLRNNNIIDSKEGKNGGYILKKDARKIKVGEIISIFSKTDLADCVNCPKEKSCDTEKIWKKLNKDFFEKIYKMSLYQFLKTK